MSTTTEQTTAWPALAGGPQFVAIDSNGNLSSKVEDGHSWTYEWNAENQLKRVLKDAVEVARFAYDPAGRRVEKVAGGVTTSYAYDADDILRQTIGSAALRYVNGTGIDEPLATENGAGQLTYEHADALGSELKQTDAAGAVTFSRSYDAFGRPQAGASTSGRAFTSREWDAETGLYYYRARYYDPKAGRFISEDPIGLMGGINLFSYVSNMPTQLVDPSGLAGMDPVKGVKKLWKKFKVWQNRKCCMEQLLRCKAQVERDCRAAFPPTTSTPDWTGSGDSNFGKRNLCEMKANPQCDLEGVKCFVVAETGGQTCPGPDPGPTPCPSSTPPPDYDTHPYRYPTSMWPCWGPAKGE